MLGVARQSRQRFDMLLLSPGEFYFDDYAAHELNISGRSIKGRLYVCSSCVVFEPDERAKPLDKYPFIDMQIDQYISPLIATEDSSSCFSIRCTTTITMHANGPSSPFIVNKKCDAIRYFRLDYVTLSVFLPRIRTLVNITKSQDMDLDDSLDQLIAMKEHDLRFDSAWLEDLTETVKIESSARLVEPLVLNPGVVVITDRKLYFQPLYNISPVPVQRWPLVTISSVVKRRHLLKRCGLEVFFRSSHRAPAKDSSGTNASGLVSSVFFSFRDEAMRDRFYRQLVTATGGSSLGRPVSPFCEAFLIDITAQWMIGDCSNYDYLMALNSVADRSFKDLTQYPVMPWVISDYSSPTLDLSSPASFRDFTKPMGAMDPERLKAYKDRYREMPEPRFLYGTHYSTPGYVVFYLVRTHPELALCLQGGRFDHSDRLFDSMLLTWTSVTKGVGDNKELIPQFFGGGEDGDGAGVGDFLLNLKGLELGTKSSGRTVEDVVLPPWAASPQAFVAINRAALESEWVSSNLHHWIDLVFGYKQRGIEAIKADNVFYHLTYEGAVDMDRIADPQERKSIQAQIAEFGQTPRQLFLSPHPQRCVGSLRGKATEGVRVMRRELRVTDQIIADEGERRALIGSPKTYYQNDKYEYDMQGVMSAPPPMSDMTASVLLSVTINPSDFIDLPQLSSLDLQPLSPLVTPTKETRSWVASTTTMAPLPSISTLPPPLTVASSPPSVAGVMRRPQTVNVGGVAVPLTATRASTPSFSLSTYAWSTLWAAQSRSTITLLVHLSYRIHREAVTALSFGKGPLNASHGPNSIISVSKDRTLKFYSVCDKCQTSSIQMSSLALSSVVIAPDGGAAFAAAWDNSIYHYDTGLARVMDTLDGHDAAVSCLAIVSGVDDTSAVGKPFLLLSGSWDGCVNGWSCVWNDRSKSYNVRSVPVFELNDGGHDSEVYSVHASPSGGVVLSTGADGLMMIWCLASQRPVKAITVSSSEPVDITACCISMDAQFVVVATSSVSSPNVSTIVVYRTTSYEHVMSWSIGYVVVGGVVSDGRWVVIGCHDGSLRLFDLVCYTPSTCAEVQVVHSDAGAITSLVANAVVSEEGIWRLAAATDKGTIHVLSIQ